MVLGTVCFARIGAVHGDEPAKSLSSDAAVVELSRKSDEASRRSFWQNAVRPFLNQHCVECHSGAEPEAGVDLSKVDELSKIEQDRARWNQVRGLIEIGAMPPPDHADLPSMEDRELIADWLDRRINTVDCNLNADPGRVTLRRLNNIEYDNTVRDLLGIEFSPSSITVFPSDGVGNGFDNQGDVLTLSPIQLEKYLQAARLVAERVIVTDRSTLKRQSHDGGQLMLHQKAEAEFDFAEGRFELFTRLQFRDVPKDKATVRVLVDDVEITTWEVDQENKRFEIKHDFAEGTHKIAFDFSADSDRDSADARRRVTYETISMEGPKEGQPRYPEIHRKLITAVPQDGVSVEQAADKIFRCLIRKAFRRNPTELEVGRTVSIVKNVVDAGESFETGVAYGLQSILVSPHFLFRVESEPTSGTEVQQSLSDDALASRLSYFLWASAPDETLLDAAAAGELHEPSQLEAHAQRMLADPRSRSLVTQFFSQSLGLGGLREVEPDNGKFPLWNDKLRAALQRETELVCEELLRENRSLLDLLSADFTYINPRLAEFYGVSFDGQDPAELYADARGSGFRRNADPARRDGNYSREDEWLRVGLPQHRKGIITHGSILTLTSNPRDTSPVKRGKWILENVLGDPPPPAPPNAPSFDETKNKHKGLTLRQQLELHRANPSCASCHRVMDPLGLGFENFDAVGRWREKDGELPIDAAGQLASGEKFAGAEELVAILETKRAQVARHFTEKLLTYALGRGLEPYDNCTVDKIVARAEKDNYRLSTVISAIVSSDPFRLRRASQENAL
ncbi:MAG: DUF1592 domain-containing protein [Pirellulales bacterium]